MFSWKRALTVVQRMDLETQWRSQLGGCFNDRVMDRRQWAGENNYRDPYISHFPNHFTTLGLLNKKSSLQYLLKTQISL